MHCSLTDSDPIQAADEESRVTCVVSSDQTICTSSTQTIRGGIRMFVQDIGMQMTPRTDSVIINYAAATKVAAAASFYRGCDSTYYRPQEIWCLIY